MPGELRFIGRRPKLVASFAGPGAATRFAEWRARNAPLLASVPGVALRVEYGRAGSHRLIRVRIDEEHVPAGLNGPDEAGAADGLPPHDPAA
ncbi:MAG: hypothetical protein ICV71_00190 [Thermoleophilia bacterium]|nr:hypothetical protein [Thermoleophilia bacterium]MDQ3858528.1 hypothetical protein [Actinomycetota bacterium]